jgi:hypothetical protein
MIAVALLPLLTLQTSTLPVRLDAGTFEQVRRYATPTNKDLSFQSLDWKPTVLDGINEANRVDKPILLWLYFGDPRGHC